MCLIGWDVWIDNFDWNLKRCFLVCMCFRYEINIMGCILSMFRKNFEVIFFWLILVGLDGVGIIFFKDSWIVMVIYRLYWFVIDESFV